MKIYYPLAEFFRDVEASPPHPPNTVYRVSVGHEMWDDGPQSVAKIQMVYDGRVSGRRSPSFPFRSDDFKRVSEALTALMALTPGSPEAALATKAHTSAQVDNIRTKFLEKQSMKV